MLKIKVDYKNNNLEITGSDIFEFDIYCQKLSTDTVSILSDIEQLLLKHKIGYNTCPEFRQIRHRLFDLSGNIKRVPDNLISDSNPQKPSAETEVPK